MANTINRISEKVIDDLFTEYPTMFVAVSKSAYINALQQALLEVIGTEIQLKRITPDYESIMLRLIQSLSTIPEWYDLITSTTGHSILRSIASGIAYDQFSIERAYQEAFLASASSNSAIFSGTRGLGIRPQRRQPPRVSVQFSRTEAITILTIPAYSVFSIGDNKYFNRESIVFNVDVFSTTKTLFQGILQYETITSDGEPFQKYTVGSGEFNASDIDVIVSVDGEVWKRSISGLFLFDREEKIYDENTAQNGDIEIAFGNGDYGKIPPLSSTISVTWVKTLGKDGEVTNSGLTVKMDTPPTNVTITGSTLTNIEDGAEIITSNIYKKIAPSMFSAQDRAVRRSDFKAQAIKFPGVYDALFRGQAELAPGRRSMMNVVGYTLLTDENWTLADYQNFEDKFIEDYAVFRLELLRIPPIEVVQNVSASVYCNPDVDLEDIKDTLIENMTELYTPKLNYLGRNMYISDISDVLKGRNKDKPNERLEQSINYVVLDPSVTSIKLTNKRQYVKLGTLSIYMYHTTRDGYSGRLDISPNQADTTIIT